jgi:hypothetical protein
MNNTTITTPKYILGAYDKFYYIDLEAKETRYLWAIDNSEYYYEHSNSEFPCFG